MLSKKLKKLQILLRAFLFNQIFKKKSAYLRMHQETSDSAGSLGKKVVEKEETTKHITSRNISSF